MPSYKLTYFNGKGRGEIARLCFAAAGQKYEDKRVEFPDWPALKPKTPQGSMPLLEVDGKFTMCQSLSIARFLAREFNLYGKGNREAGLVEQILDTCLDVFTPFVTIAFMQDEKEKAEKMKDFAEEKLPKLLGYIEDLIKQTGSGGYSVGKALTVADLMIFNILDGAVAGANPGLLEKFKLLATLKKTVEGLPKIKAWLEKRPKTDF